MEAERGILSAVDAVRCLYLARILKQKGEFEASERWNREAQRWVASLLSVAGFEALSDIESEEGLDVDHSYDYRV